MPRVQVNRPALWTLATCGVIVGFAALAAVGALTTLGPGDDSGQDDPLTALALLLAILAFVVQIFVYAFQTGQSNAATRRREELNTETRGALNEIRANSAATQKVLFSQFDRLLDYVVGPEAAARGDEAAQEVDEPESAPEEEGRRPLRRFAGYSKRAWGGPPSLRVWGRVKKIRGFWRR